jgi:hypothetical protein
LVIQRLGAGLTSRLSSRLLINYLGRRYDEVKWAAHVNRLLASLRHATQPW